MLALYTKASVRLRRDEKGATAVEYGIMVALIAVVIIVAVTFLGNNLNAMFKAVECQVGGGTWAATDATATAAATGTCTR